MSKMLDVYDFDKTIYDGDSSLDFYLFCLKNDLNILKYLPFQIYGAFLYYAKFKNKEYFKENFFSFLKNYKNIDDVIIEFWNINENKIKYNLLNKSKNSSVVISASPYFLLKYISEKIGINTLIATDVDKTNGKFMGENCYGKEKLQRFKNIFKDLEIENFYSDSKSDKYLANIAKNAYLNQKVSNINIGIIKNKYEIVHNILSNLI
ncbi:MAG: haloacid dehalogenase-like hydrolase [Clostridia bacterium]